MKTFDKETKLSPVTYYCAGCSTEIVKPWGKYIKYYNITEYDKIKQGIPLDVVIPEKEERAFCNNCSIIIEQAVNKTSWEIQKRVNIKRHVLSNS